MTATDPGLVGERVELQPLDPEHYPFVRALELHPERLATYRHRATTPSPEAFVQRLWNGVLTQFVVVDRDARRPLGIVAAFAADFRNANAQIAFVSAGEGDFVAGVFLDGVELFVDYVFAHFDLRKLYAHTLEPNLRRLSRLVGEVVQCEGVLREHEYLGGRWVDLHVLAVHRADWERRDGYLLRSDRRSVSTPEALDADVFASTVLELLGATPTERDDPMALRLGDDLGLDSLGALLLLELIEGGTDRSLDVRAVDTIGTVGDAYHFHCALRGS